jgi:hypothetical protein
MDQAIGPSASSPSVPWDLREWLAAVGARTAMLRSWAPDDPALGAVARHLAAAQRRLDGAAPAPVESAPDGAPWASALDDALARSVLALAQLATAEVVALGRSQRRRGGGRRARAARGVQSTGSRTTATGDGAAPLSATG